MTDKKFEIRGSNIANRPIDMWHPFPVKNSDGDAWSQLLKIGWTELKGKHVDGRTVEFREAPLCTHINLTETISWKKLGLTNSTYNARSRLYICDNCGATGKSPIELRDPSA